MCVSSRRLFSGWKYWGPGLAENSQYSCWAVEALRAHLGLQLWRQPPVSGRWPGIWCHSSSNSSQRWSQQLFLALLHVLGVFRAGLGFPRRWELWNLPALKTHQRTEIYTRCLWYWCLDASSGRLCVNTALHWTGVHGKISLGKEPWLHQGSVNVTMLEWFWTAGKWLSFCSSMISEVILPALKMLTFLEALTKRCHMSPCHVPGGQNKHRSCFLGILLYIEGCCLKWQLESILLPIPFAVGF